MIRIVGAKGKQSAVPVLCRVCGREMLKNRTLCPSCQRNRPDAARGKRGNTRLRVG